MNERKGTNVLAYCGGLYDKLHAHGGTYTFVHEQPEVTAYIEGGKSKGFDSDICVVKIWSLYIEDGVIMLHVHDHADGNMHSANLSIDNVDGSIIDELVELIK